MNESNRDCFIIDLGPSPKRTLISRQNLIKTKSPVRESLNFECIESDT